MTNSHTVIGGGGISLQICEYGNPGGIPVLFLHGMFQSGNCWKDQFTSGELRSYRMLIMDLRGHGHSEKPEKRSCYTNNDLWADDLACVIKQLELNRPVLVGWSYSGYMICDYISKYGDKNLSGINMVSTPYLLTGDRKFCGPGLLSAMDGLLSTDGSKALEATKKWLQSIQKNRLSGNMLKTMLEESMAVPPVIRRALISRKLDYNGVLKTISVPVLVTFGSDDDFILPQAGLNICNLVKNSSLSIYHGLKHAVFMDQPQRFNSELHQFIQTCKR